ncbi:MAG TPA: hypothetical protein VIA62_24930 [Thermoanaerobaculia bacterium]|jgi:hypothetical protein|nr:hypothetical protein [Thermoanaerobaculia bacterium]
MAAEPEEWEIVKVVGTPEEATIVVGFLNSSGIEAEAESLHVSELPTDLGDLSEIRIRVPSEQAQEARALLDSREDIATGEEGEEAGEPLEESPGEDQDEP